MANYINGARPKWVHSTRLLSLLMGGILTILLFMNGCQPADPVQEARVHFAKGDIIGGIEILRVLLDEGRDDPEILFLYGEALSHSGQPALAEWPLRKAMEDPEWFERAGMAVAKNVLVGGNSENAAEILGQIVEANPDNMQARLMRAGAFASSPRHLRDALAEVDEIFEINPNEIRAFEPQILAYLKLEDGEGAEEALEAFGAQIDDGHGDEWNRGWYCATMAIFASDGGDDDLARERWADCNERFPAHKNVVKTSSDFFAEHDENERALEIAQAAFEADSSVANGNRELVTRFLAALDRNDEAEALMREAAESDDPNEAMDGYFLLVRHYERLKDFNAAAGALEDYLEYYEPAFGQSPEHIFWLADLLILADQDDRALALSERMLVTAHRALVRARLAQRRGDYAQALRLFSKASRLWPDNVYAPYHAGHAAIALGDFDTAISSFRGSIRISPTVTDAPLQVARINAAEGRWKAASDSLAQAKPGFNSPAGLYWIEIVSHINKPDGMMRTVADQSEKNPELAGVFLAATAKGVGDAHGAEVVWPLIEQSLGYGVGLDQQILIIRSAIEWAPGARELASLEPRIRVLVKSQPEMPVVKLIEGTFEARQGEMDAATSSFRAALELFSGDPEADAQDRAETKLRLASMIARQDPEEAMNLVDQVLSDESTPLDSKLFVAAVADLEISDRTVALLERGLERAPLNPDIALRLGEALEGKEGQERRVLALASRAVRFQGGESARALLDRNRNPDATAVDGQIAPAAPVNPTEE